MFGKKIILTLRFSGFSRFLLAVQTNCNAIGLRMHQTSEGEVVSEDRDSEPRTNGGKFGKPVTLYHGSVFPIVCMTSKLLSMSNSIFPML